MRSQRADDRFAVLADAGVDRQGRLVDGDVLAVSQTYRRRFAGGASSGTHRSPAGDPPPGLMFGPLDPNGQPVARVELTVQGRRFELQLLIDTGASGTLVSANRLPGQPLDFRNAWISPRAGIGGKLEAKRLKCESLRILAPRGLPPNFPTVLPNIDFLLGPSPFGDHDGLLGTRDMRAMTLKLIVNFAERTYGFESR